jgi:hypothetical protein
LIPLKSNQVVTLGYSRWRDQLKSNQVVALGYSISHMIVWFDTIPTGWSKGRKNRDKKFGKRNSSYKFIACIP